MPQYVLIAVVLVGTYVLGAEEPEKGKTAMATMLNAGRAKTVPPGPER